MYRPAQFREDRPEILAAAIQTLHFATLVTSQGSQLLASDIPMVLKKRENQYILEGHVARANPQWREIDTAATSLAVFVGPHSYISPTWYSSKAEHQKVVPTWNYISVQASGRLTVYEEREWLLRHIEELTEHNEADRAHPWTIHDAPADFINQLCGGIVGLSMEVRQLEGAWKMAQHRSHADRLGVIEGLSEFGTDSAQQVAAEMRRLEDERDR